MNNFIGLDIGADAEHRQLVVIPARRALRRLAAQHIDDVDRAEALAGPIDRGQRLLRRGGGLPCLRRLETGVAVAAGPALLAEIGEQPDAATGGGLWGLESPLLPLLAELG